MGGLRTRAGIFCGPTLVLTDIPKDRRYSELSYSNTSRPRRILWSLFEVEKTTMRLLFQKKKKKSKIRRTCPGVSELRIVRHHESFRGGPVFSWFDQVGQHTIPGELKHQIRLLCKASWETGGFADRSVWNNSTRDVNLDQFERHRWVKHTATVTDPCSLVWKVICAALWALIFLTTRSVWPAVCVVCTLTPDKKRCRRIRSRSVNPPCADKSLGLDRPRWLKHRLIKGPSLYLKGYQLIYRCRERRGETHIVPVDMSMLIHILFPPGLIDLKTEDYNLKIAKDKYDALKIPSPQNYPCADIFFLSVCKER